MIERKTRNESKIILEENEILVVTLKDKDNSIICRTYNKCMIGLTINHITKREFINRNNEKRLSDLGFRVFFKILEKDENLTISSVFSTHNLDVSVFETKTTNNTTISWKVIEREKESEL